VAIKCENRFRRFGPSMTTLSLIKEIRALGCTLQVEGESLRVRPASLLTDSLREAIREHKTAILSLICRECGEPLRATEHARYRAFECPADSTHRVRIENLNSGQPMGLFADSPAQGCRVCGWQGATYGGQCSICLQREVELERKVETPMKETRELNAREQEIIKTLYELKAKHRATIAYVTTTRELPMQRWNGKHPVDENTKTDLIPAGSTLKIVMVSRFGDVGLTDDMKREHGYGLRVDIEDPAITDIRWQEQPLIEANQ
jgi:hypothetical protein